MAVVMVNLSRGVALVAAKFLAFPRQTCISRQTAAAPCCIAALATRLDDILAVAAMGDGSEPSTVPKLASSFRQS
jgi:hypothetical protein